MATQHANLRGVTLRENGYHSNSTSLCSRCYNPHCQNFAAMDCGDFIPALRFKPPLRGFDYDRFNTFRIGLGWSKRVRIGSVVALVNTKTDEIFSHARVIDIRVGDKYLLAKLYGKDNHSIKALNVTDNIANVMLKRLKNSCGSMIYNSTNAATVIYLEKIDENTNQRNGRN